MKIVKRAMVGCRLLSLFVTTMGAFARMSFSRWGRTALLATYELKPLEPMLGIDMKSCAFKYKGRTCFLYGKDAIGLANEIFRKGEYSFLDGEPLVVDIGTNIGDTALYFIMNGTKKVFAYEPFPYSFNKAMKNVELNNISEKVALFMMAVGKETGTVCLTNEETEGITKLSSSSNGSVVPITTLKEITMRHKIRNGALKIDCEGMEHDILENTSNEILERYSKIMLETDDAERTVRRFNPKKWKIIIKTNDLVGLKRI